MTPEHLLRQELCGVGQSQERDLGSQWGDKPICENGTGVTGTGRRWRGSGEGQRGPRGADAEAEAGWKCRAETQAGLWCSKGQQQEGGAEVVPVTVASLRAARGRGEATWACQELRPPRSQC